MKSGEINTNIQATDNLGSGPNQTAFIDEFECLRRVHLSRRTWFTWRRAGKIPAIKLGRRTLYHWASVEAALLRMQRGGTE